MHKNKGPAHYLLLHTIHDVLKTEKILKKHGLAFELVPVPRNLSSDCGSCIKLIGNLEETLQHLAGIEIVKCFLYDGKEFTAVVLPGKES